MVFYAYEPSEARKIYPGKTYLPVSRVTVMARVLVDLSYSWAQRKGLLMPRVCHLKPKAVCQPWRGGTGRGGAEVQG